MSNGEASVVSGQIAADMAAWTDLQKRLLRTLAQTGPQSRADLARALGVMRSTVGEPAQALLDQGAIRKQKQPGSPVETIRAGRPGKRLELNPDYCAFLGVDVGIGHVLALRTNFQGDIVAQVQMPMQPEHQTPVAVAKAAQQLIRRLSNDIQPIAGLMASLPGIVERSGLVHRVPPLKWQEVEFAELLAPDCAYPLGISLENDANVFSAAYLAQADTDAIDNALFVWLDEGIGGAIVANGQPAPGSHGFSGEIGHITVSGRAGSGRKRLEDIAGGPALLRRNIALGGSAEDLTALLAESAAGCTAAIRALDEWATALADGLASLTSVLNPGEIVFGGPMVPVLRSVMGALQDLYAEFLMPGTPMPRWRLLSTREDYLAAGCCTLLRESMFRHIA